MTGPAFDPSPDDAAVAAPIKAACGAMQTILDGLPIGARMTALCHLLALNIAGHFRVDQWPGAQRFAYLQIAGTLDAQLERGGGIAAVDAIQETATCK